MVFKPFYRELVSFITRKVYKYENTLWFYKDSSGNIRVNAGKTETVKLIYDLYLKGSSLRKIADTFSEKKILSPTEKGGWAVQVIDNILSNRLYLRVVASEKFV